MAKEQEAKTKRPRAGRAERAVAASALSTGNDRSTGKERRTKPNRSGARNRAAPRASVAIERAGSGPDATDWRFHLATLVRVSDNLVSRAVGAYDRVFALDKRDESEIYLSIGKKLANEEKLDDALTALRRVLRTKPNHEEALFEIGLIQVRRGAPLAAIEMLQKARAAGMKSVRLSLLLADVLGREDRFAEALEEIDCALAMKNTVADTHYRRGVLLDRLERYADAVTAFQEAIRLAPREVHYHQNLGFTLESMGRRSAAVNCFKRALELERARDLESMPADD